MLTTDESYPIWWMDSVRENLAATGLAGGSEPGPLSQGQSASVKAVARAFYEVVPQELRTFCSVTSRIAQAALSRLGLPARLTPCQVWLTTEDSNYVVGFLGHAPRDDKWDGHVICTVGDWFIDAALTHFRTEFSQDTPAVVAGRTFQVKTAAIARLDLTPTDRLVWIAPPDGIDTTPPDEPPDLVARYAQALAERVASQRR